VSVGLYVYALLGAGPTEPLGEGIAGEPLRVATIGRLRALVGEMPERPPLSVAALRSHDAAIRRAMAVTEAVLPARFGSLMDDERDVERRLEPEGDALEAAIALVSGAEQMTVRVHARDPAPAGPLRNAEGLGPGARYLAERRRAGGYDLRRAALEALLPALRGAARAERVESHATPPLIASVHHLIRRGTAKAYAALVERAAAEIEGVAVTISGPWPAYAFAAEEPA